MSHFGALAAASSRYAALCGAPTDPRSLPWYWGRLQPQLTQDRPSPTGIYSLYILKNLKVVTQYKLKEHELVFFQTPILLVGNFECCDSKL